MTPRHVRLSAMASDEVKRMELLKLLQQDDEFKRVVSTQASENSTEEADAEASLAMSHLAGASGLGMRDEVELPPPEWANVYTVMMRNLPNKYTQQLLRSELDAAGFWGLYDFLYLPIDLETSANKGYAFLNFVDPSYAWVFRATFEGRKLGRFNSNKVVTITPAALQGFEANHEHYSSSRVSRGDPAARPLFLRQPLVTGKKSAADSAGAQGARGRVRRSRNSLIDAAAREQQKNAALPMPPWPGMAPLLPFLPMMGVPMPGLLPPFDEAPGGTDEVQAAFECAAKDHKYRVAAFCHACGARMGQDHAFCSLCGAPRIDV